MLHSDTVDSRLRKSLLEAKKEVRDLRGGGADSVKRLTSLTKGHRLAPLAAIQGPPCYPLGHAIQRTEEICLPVEVHTLRVEQALTQTSAVNTLVPADPEVTEFSKGKCSLQPRMHWNADLFKQHPASRQSAIQLDKYLTEMLEQLHESNATMIADSAPRVQHMRDCQCLYNLAMHEVTRQVSAHCLERGHLLAKLWVRSGEVFNTLMELFHNHNSNSQQRIADLEDELRRVRRGALITGRSAEQTLKAVTEGAQQIIEGHIAEQKQLHDEIMKLKKERYRAVSRTQKLEKDLDMAHDELKKTDFWEKMYKKCQLEQNRLKDELTATKVALMEKVHEVAILKESAGVLSSLTRTIAVQADDVPPMIGPGPDYQRLSIRQLFTPTSLTRTALKNPTLPPPPKSLDLNLPSLYSSALACVDTILRYPTTATVDLPTSMNFLIPVGRLQAQWSAAIEGVLVDRTKCEGLEATVYAKEWKDFTVGKVLCAMARVDTPPASYVQTVSLMFSIIFDRNGAVRLLDLVTSLRDAQKLTRKVGLFCLMLGLGFEETALPPDTARTVLECMRRLLPDGSYPSQISVAQVLEQCMPIFFGTTRDDLSARLLALPTDNGMILTDVALLLLVRMILEERTTRIEQPLNAFFSSAFKSDSGHLNDVRWLLQTILNVEVPENILTAMFPYKTVKREDFVRLLMKFSLNIVDLVPHISTMDPLRIRTDMIRTMNEKESKIVSE